MTAYNAHSHLPTIIDVEASKFGRGSFPVEVGFIRSDGFTFCRLIKPQKSWTNWDEEVEKIHGISRQALQTQGQSVRDVARELNEQLAGKRVYSDAWGQDFAWLSNLFEEAEIIMSFKLESLSSLLTDAQKKIWKDTRKKVEEMLGLGRHRASADARVIQMTYHWTAGSSACRSPHAALDLA